MNEADQSSVVHNNMKIYVTLLLFLLSAFFSVAESHADTQPLTLQQCYELAKKQSESLQRRQQDVKIAYADYREAVALLYPNIHLIAQDRYRSSENFGVRGSGTSEDDINGGVSSGSASRRKRYQFETALNVRQPIFSGFRDFLLAQAAQSQIKARELDVQRATQELYFSVAELFYQVHLYAGDIEIIKKLEQNLEERTKELKKFIDLGKSRESEVLAVIADLEETRLFQAQSLGLQRASLELLAFLVGIPSATLKLAKDDVLPQAALLDSYLQQAEQRFDLQSAAERKNSASKQLTASEREHWPTVALEGNYYPYEDPDINREWELLLRLDIPVFEGGAIDARVDRQRALLRTSELALDESKRVVDRQVRLAYNDFQTAQAKLKTIPALLNAHEKSLASQRKDYELGVVTNLEVLQAIRSLQDVRRQLLQAQSELRVSYARLAVTAGGDL